MTDQDKPTEPATVTGDLRPSAEIRIARLERWVRHLFDVCTHDRRFIYGDEFRALCQPQSTAIVCILASDGHDDGSYYCVRLVTVRDERGLQLPRHVVARLRESCLGKGTTEREAELACRSAVLHGLVLGGMPIPDRIDFLFHKDER